MIYKPSNGLEWFGINDLAIYGWIYSLGVEVYYLLGDIKEKVNIAGWKTAAICIVGGGISLLISLLKEDNDKPDVLIACLMISVILLVCIVWNGNTKLNRKSLIAQTYQIFILSWPCQLVVEIIVERILHLQWWIILPTVFMAGVIGPLIIIKTIDLFEIKTKTHLLSLIIGK